MIVATDLEGTLTAGATWKGFASYLKAHGRAAEFNAFYYPRLPMAVLYRLNLVDRAAFRSKWIADMLRFFAGVPVEAFDEVAEWVVEREMWPQRREAVLTELSDHLAQGYRVVLTSGSYTPIVRRFAERVGITEVIATPVHTADGIFTGKPDGPRNTGQNKAESLRQHLDAPLDLAYGDTMADRPMLEMSREGVVVHPERPLRNLAQQKGWRIVET